jgi:hypothetical protein
MRRYVLAVTLAALVLGTLAAVILRPASAQGNSAVAIPIMNSRFNLDVLACSPGYDCYGNAGITGWVCGPNTSIQKMSTAQYPNAPSTGLTVGSLGNTTGTGSVLQTLGATVQANTTYTLAIGVGARADFAFTGYNAALMAGNVTLVSGHKATPEGRSFVTEVLVYNSGAAPAQLGQPMQVFVNSLGTGQINLSGVALTAAPTIK